MYSVGIAIAQKKLRCLELMVQSLTVRHPTIAERKVCPSRFIQDVEAFFSIITR